jgi:hypothetical protein
MDEVASTPFRSLEAKSPTLVETMRPLVVLTGPREGARPPVLACSTIESDQWRGVGRDDIGVSGHLNMVERRHVHPAGALLVKGVHVLGPVRSAKGTVKVSRLNVELAWVSVSDPSANRMSMSPSERVLTDEIVRSSLSPGIPCKTSPARINFASRRTICG